MADTPIGSFEEDYAAFICNVKAVLEAQGPDEGTSAGQKWVELCGHVAGQLADERVQNRVASQAFSNLDKPVYESLWMEMDYFNARCRDNGGYVRSDGAAKDAKTIKDSLKDLLPNPPDWIKKLLHVLNELLSLSRTGA